jgi:hypothetical protein
VSVAPADGVLHLAVPADPAFALTARLFAGALTQHLESATPEDLKLAFSELLAAAVGAGSDVVEYRVDLGRSEIVVRGVSLDAGASEDVEEHERFARTHRADLLTALFPRLRQEDGVLVLPLAAE